MSNASRNPFDREKALAEERNFQCRGLRVELGILSDDDLAGMFDISRRTLRTWRREKTGPRCVVVAHQGFYLAEDVLDWFNELAQAGSLKAGSLKAGGDVQSAVGGVASGIASGIANEIAVAESSADSEERAGQDAA